MKELLDLRARALVLTADDARWEEVFRRALRTASCPDGRELEPVRVDPRRLEDVAEESVLDLLEAGAAVVADLDAVPRPLFDLLAWHARARPLAVLLLRPGARALPFELHELPVHTIEADTPERAVAARRSIARLATIGADSCRGPLGELLGSPEARRRRERDGVADMLRTADVYVLAGEAPSAVEGMERACEREPQAADLRLRHGILLRQLARWDDAIAQLEQAVRLDDTLAAAWRELGVARDRSGAAGAEEALRRALDHAEDYQALVALSKVVGRQAGSDEPLRLLERAMDVCEGALNLVLPVRVLRAAQDRGVSLDAPTRERLGQVLEIRRRQATADPPEDAPWSHFDAAAAHLLLGEGEPAAALVAAAKPFCKAGWEPDVLARTLDDLERAGCPVAAARERLGARPRRERPAEPAPKKAAAPSRPFRAEARDAAWFARNVPCATACPVGTDAGTYVALAARGDFPQAYRTARAPNPFASVCGRVCAAPCEDACRRGRVDEPVAIRAIKRFLTERHGPEGDDVRVRDVLDGSPVPGIESVACVSHLTKLGRLQRGARRVAVAGGGPSGLACAHDLAFLGYRVTLFEPSDHLGGMMRHGIPEHRLPRPVLDKEIEVVLGLGVEVRLSEGLGSTRTLRSLFDGGFEAVFLASGAGRGRDLEVEGGGLDGVVRAIDFLINVNRGFKIDLGTKVVVVGGGNVAIDAARTSRLGRPPGIVPGTEAREAARELAPALKGEALRAALRGGEREVHVVARPPLGEWPAQQGVHGREEVEEARREGVILHPLRGVRRILGEHGRVTAVELAEVVRVTDERGRYAPAYGSTAAETIPCDAVLLAVGQEPDLDYLEAIGGVHRTREGTIEVDRETLATNVPGVYAGGDAAFGPRTLIQAVSDGKRAARSIHAFLAGAEPLPRLYTFEEVHPRGVQAEGYDRLPRVEPPCIETDRRTGIAEVETGYDEAEALRQARRCLECHVQTVYDGTLCVACGRCVDVCPHRCLSLVAPADAEVVGLDPMSVAAAAGGEEAVLMLKDEDLCVRCGLCAERCPTGAMTMERYAMAAVGATP